SMEHLWRALHKGRWLILAVATVVSAAAAFYTLGQTKIYRAVAVIQIDPTPVSPLGGDVQAVVTMGADNFFTNQEYYATQYRILKSRRTATDAVKDLGLHRDASFAKNQAAASGTEVPESTAADALLARLSVDPIKESRLVTVSFDDADPERARRVLSAVINSYLERNVDDVALSNTTASKWLQEQLSKLKKDLEKSELALHEFKKEKRILSVSLDDQNNMLGDEIKQLNAALTQVRTQREHVQSRAQELSKVDRSDPVALPAAELLENGLLTTLRGNYISAKSDLASIQKSGKGDNHPDVRASAARVATTRDALLKEIKNVQDAVGGNLRALTREAGGLKRLNDGAKQRALDINILEIEYRRLERTKVNNEKLFGVVLERTKETQLASMMRFNNIRVVEEARATAGPVKPRVPLNIGLGVMAGVVLG
ncbi:MAG TPA: GumC family protein, partial [Polyangiaceae bacterium]|nr:GumC family protein [Polyangiaceae bacterium]